MLLRGATSTLPKSTKKTSYEFFPLSLTILALYHLLSLNLAKHNNPFFKGGTNLFASYGTN